jgi:hypothetical protein
MTAPGPGTAVPSAATVAPAAPKILVRMLMTMPTPNETSAHHQYSLRLARPVNVAYFLKKRLHAHGAEPGDFGQDHHLGFLEAADAFRQSRSRQQTKCASSLGSRLRLYFTSRARTLTPSPRNRRPGSQQDFLWMLPAHLFRHGHATRRLLEEGDVGRVLSEELFPP